MGSCKEVPLCFHIKFFFELTEIVYRFAILILCCTPISDKMDKISN